MVVEAAPGENIYEVRLLCSTYLGGCPADELCISWSLPSTVRQASGGWLHTLLVWLSPQLAKRSGVDITVGCCSKSCGICEVEVTLVDASGMASARRVTRSCVAGIPPGFARIEIDDLGDGIWGVDGYDT